MRIAGEQLRFDPLGNAAVRRTCQRGDGEDQKQLQQQRAVAQKQKPQATKQRPDKAQRHRQQRPQAWAVQPGAAIPQVVAQKRDGHPQRAQRRQRRQQHKHIRPRALWRQQHHAANRQVHRQQQQEPPSQLIAPTPRGLQAAQRHQQRQPHDCRGDQKVAQGTIALAAHVAVQREATQHHIAAAQRIQQLGELNQDAHPLGEAQPKLEDGRRQQRIGNQV